MVDASRIMTHQYFYSLFINHEIEIYMVMIQTVLDQIICFPIFQLSRLSLQIWACICCSKMFYAQTKSYGIILCTSTFQITF